jgi:hypothetical protein
VVSTEASSHSQAQLLASALAFLLSAQGDFLLEVLLTELVVGMESMSKVQVASALRDLQPAAVEQLPSQIAPLVRIAPSPCPSTACRRYRLR